MERIQRESYLSILKNFKDKQIIKVITGIRRCGKSTLLELFQDYSEDERTLFVKAQEGKEITPEEQAVVEKMTVEINAMAGHKKSELIDGFLASQLRLPNSSQDYNKRLEFWRKFPFLEKWAIVQRVEERLGLTERTNEKLFPAD